MRHLAFRFVKHAPSSSGSNFVIDPYLDYRRRLEATWYEGLKKRGLNINYDAIRSGYQEWWRAFSAYNKDPDKLNKMALLDKADGLTTVLKLPNTVIDLKFVEVKHAQHTQELEFLRPNTQNKAAIGEWLSNSLYDHMFSCIPTVIRHSPSYRVRPAFIDACNLSEADFLQVSEDNDLYTILTGISLPAQLATFMKSRFSKNNSFPSHFFAAGMSYRNYTSKIKQELSASLLSVSDRESTAISAFHLVSNSFAAFLRQLGVSYSIDRTGPEKLEPYESASLSFYTESKDDLVGKVSFIGPYISERLNIQLQSPSKYPSFVFLSHTHVNLDRIGELL